MISKVNAAFVRRRRKAKLGWLAKTSKLSPSYFLLTI